MSDAFMNRNSIDVIYTGFAKAFDKLNHQILFPKLQQIGVWGSFLKWLVNFIRDRF
jgi:hypothetical protein